jgi:hypothetical protein
MYRFRERSIPKKMGCFKNRLGTVFKENHLREDSMKAAEVQSEKSHAKNEKLSRVSNCNVLKNKSNWYII